MTRCRPRGRTPFPRSARKCVRDNLRRSGSVRTAACQPKLSTAPPFLASAGGVGNRLDLWRKKRMTGSMGTKLIQKGPHMTSIIPRTRRDFLADVGRGVLLATVGSELAGQLGLATAHASDTA